MQSEFEELCSKVRCRAYGEAKVRDDWHDAHPYKVILSYQGRQLTTVFYTGPGWNRDPNAFDVLDCLVSDATSIDCSDSFEIWAGDLGYDPDSRKAEKIYKECLKTNKDIKRLLGNDYSKFKNAER